MKSKGTLDRLARFITISVIVLLVVSSGAMILWLSHEAAPGEHIALIVCTGLLMLLLPILTRYYAPYAYSITAKELIIHCHSGRKIISVKSIKSARMLQNDETRGALRLFGVGGMFGYYGTYYFPKIGSLKLYATHRSLLILIETEKGKWVISPDDARDFVNAITEVITTKKG